MKLAVLIKDFLDTDGLDWAEITKEITSRCGLDYAEYIVMRIVRDFGSRRKDIHVPNPSTEYRLTDNLYEDLYDLCKGEDCKNGIQIYYDDMEDTYYFQITGANFYDKENKYAGSNSVKVYLKEFIW